MKRLPRIPSALLALLLPGCVVSPEPAPEPTSTTEQATTVCGTQTSVKGVDVSHYDGAVDWATVKAGGISFAFVKASEGTSYVDPTFATNWAGMKAAGVVRGAYHFFDAGTDPTAQANHALATIGALEAGDLPIVLDFEASGSTLADATTFLAAVTKGSGKTAIIYTSPAFLSSYSGLGNYPLWVANWGVSCPDVPSTWSTWTFWQSSDTGSVSGIPGASAVDLDTFNGTLAQLTGSVTSSSGGGSGSGSGSGSGGSSGSSSGAGSGGGSGSSGSGGSSGGSTSSGSGSSGGSGAGSSGSGSGSSGSSSGGHGSSGGSSGGSGSGGDAGVAGWDSPMSSSGGCSVGDAGTGTRVFPAALALVLAAVSRRRRRA